MSKKLFYFSFILLVLGVISTSRAELIAYYALDEGAGNVVADGSGNGYDGIPEPTTGNFSWVQGKDGSALRFAGTGAPVYCGTFDPAKGTGQFTISCWVNFEGNNGTYQGILSKRDGYTAGAVRYNLETQNAAAGAAGATLSFTLTATNTRIWSAYSPPLNAWDMLTVTYDGANATLYVNGVLSSGPTALAFDNGENAAVLIGTANRGGSSPFNGAIDEVYIFSTALSVEEINSLMNGEINQILIPE